MKKYDPLFYTTPFTLQTEYNNLIYTQNRLSFVFIHQIQ
jgi:hypothetical protein